MGECDDRVLCKSKTKKTVEKLKIKNATTIIMRQVVMCSTCSYHINVYKCIHNSPRADSDTCIPTGYTATQKKNQFTTATKVSNGLIILFEHLLFISCLLMFYARLFVIYLS